MKLIAMMLVFVLLWSSSPFAAAGQGTPVARSAEYWYAYASKLPIGSVVRVRTTDGKRHTAVLAFVDRTGITLEPRTRIPETARRFRFDDILQLEIKQNGSSLGKAIAVGAAVGAGTFFGIIALIAAAGAWD